MADIKPELTAWKNAIYGEEVRDAQISLSEKLNEEVEQATQIVEDYEAAETGRVKAENARVTAETKRQIDTTKAVRNAETATENAEKAYERLKDIDVSQLTDEIDEVSVRVGDAETDIVALNTDSTKLKTANGGNFALGESIRQWAISLDVQHSVKFAVNGALPTGLPIEEEGWIEVFRDSGGARMRVFFHPFTITLSSYKRGIFQDAWQQGGWTQV